MKDRPSVSVIIPTFNSAQYLTKSIESVLDQSLQDYEIIVIDDGSTDNTTKVIKPYQSHLRFIKQTNRGPGAARNTGIDAANANYLVFLDADDLLLPDKLGIQSSFLDHHPDIGAVFSDVVCFFTDDSGEEKIRSFPTARFVRRSIGQPSNSLEVLAVQNIFPPLSAMVRRSCVDAVGGFDESRELIGLEDWDLWYRIAESHNIYYLDELVGKYRVVAESVSQNRERMKRASSLLERKIRKSQSLNTLSTAALSDFYFSWGVQWLNFGEPEMAINRFRRAITINPRHLLLQAAYLLTKLMGKRAVIFYHLKRKTLGLRGNFRALWI